MTERENPKQQIKRRLDATRKKAGEDFEESIQKIEPAVRIPGVPLDEQQYLRKLFKTSEEDKRDETLHQIEVIEEELELIPEKDQQIS